jgi:arsenate reductase
LTDAGIRPARRRPGAHLAAGTAGDQVTRLPPPSATELTEVLRRLDARAWEICRTGEPVAVALGMADWPRDDATEPRWVEAMAAHPALIQRPILLLDDGSALVARTPEALAEAVRRAAPEDA